VPEVTPAEKRFEALVRSHGPRLLAYLARRTPAEDAADAYQEALTIAWRKIHNAPDDEARAVAWLLAIGRRTLANHRRSRYRRLAATERLRAELAAYAPRPQETDEEGDRVRLALATLAEDDREVLALTYWEGLTSEQVATVVGASAAASRKRLQRARERLGAALTTRERTEPALSTRQTAV
jgi:RNA polymerase sigma-70 factor, ECF subfamily